MRTSKFVTGGRLAPGTMALCKSNFKSPPNSGIWRRARVKSMMATVPDSQCLSLPIGRIVLMSILLALEDACC